MKLACGITVDDDRLDDTGIIWMYTSDFADLPCNVEDGYCNSDFREGKTYADWEKNVCTPFLIGFGFEVGGWWTSESDSFGPMARSTIIRHRNNPDQRIHFCVN